LEQIRKDHSKPGLGIVRLGTTLNENSSSTPPPTPSPSTSKLSAFGKPRGRLASQNKTKKSKNIEQIELQAKLLNFFLGSNKSNINQGLLTGRARKPFA